MPTQNVCNSLRDYKVAFHLAGNEVGKKFYLCVGEGIGNGNTSENNKTH
jgi:hypothetical protein